MTKPSSDAMARRPRWPWVVLGLGLAWTAFVRVPLVLNAEDHLDSDLAVDGLTLLDALGGHWRWHYPGTPHIGILPMLFSYPQALVWGANAFTLVSGGTVIWLSLVAATFWLAQKAYGPTVAGWAILPLVFSTPGTIWLSGRITGGHLLTLVWHTVALAGLHSCLTHGGRVRLAAQGLWCGLGLYLDAMFTFTVAALVAAALFARIAHLKSRSAIVTIIIVLAATIIGLLPREVGRRIDPFDAYPSQFALTLDGAALREHGRLLAWHCLPRLIAGVQVNVFDRPIVGRDNPLGGRRSSVAENRRGSSVLRWLDASLAVLILVVFLVGFIRLLRDPARTLDPARKAVDRGICWSSLCILAGFLVNRNIFDSDNYRYLIYLLTPWALGFGLLCDDWARRGRSGLIGALLAAGVLAAVMTATTLRWYRDERGYLTERGMPVRVPVQPWSELIVETRASPGAPRKTFRYAVPTDVTHVFGGYWDVYRTAFLSGGRLTGIPFPMYPNRFPGWSHGLGPGQGALLALPPDFEPRFGSPQQDDGPVNRRASRPVRMTGSLFWVEPLTTVWQGAGRAASELQRVRVVIPSSNPAGR
jgi:hypothetical protein